MENPESQEQEEKFPKVCKGCGNEGSISYMSWEKSLCQACDYWIERGEEYD